MNEKQLLDRLKRDADAVTLPETLSPEAIERMLCNAKAKTNTDASSQNSAEPASDSSNTQNFSSDSVSSNAQKQFTSWESDNAHCTSFAASADNRSDTQDSTQNADSSNADFSSRKGGSNMKKHTSFYRYAMRYGSLAAVFVLGVTVLWQANQISSLKENQAPLPRESGKAAVVIETEPLENSSQDTDTEDTRDTDNEKTSVPDTNQNAAEASLTEKNDEGSENQADVNGSLYMADSTAEGSKDIHETNAASTDGASDSGSTSESADASDLSDASNDIDSSKSVKAVSAPQEDAFTYAESYEQIYDTLKDKLGLALYGRDSAYDVYAESASDTGVSVASSADSVTSSESDAKALSDFSETNLQEMGVDEGDIVKTDGQYLYILKQDLSFSIIRADGSDLTLCSTTGLDVSSLSNASVKELYLDGSQLTVLFQGTQTSLEQEDEVYYTTSQMASVLCTYDISEPSAPKLTGSLTQEGRYATSRKVGDYLYLFTSYTPSLLDTYASSTMAPRVNGTVVPASCFYLPEQLSSQQYLVITAVDLSAQAAVTDQKVLVSGADNFYVSTENIYIATENYNSDDTFTELAKFHYDSGHITGVAAGSVRGYLNNSFSLNEYNGYLRVVSTYYNSSNDDWTEKNALTIFDESLKQVSTIDDLASGETIRSARFLGDTGYFVTFRQTDPLFRVDLSDPSSPKITGELKVSGFSSYLHFYGENLLLGIGYETDETTGETTGIKLSMFDLSDPDALNEVNRVVIPGITWAPAVDDYKSILVDAKKNLIGFYCDGRYFVYSYDSTNGFERMLVYDFFEDDLMDTAQYDTMRGLYIGDTLYLAGDGFVIPFDLADGCSKQEVFRY